MAHYVTFEDGGIRVVAMAADRELVRLWAIGCDSGRAAKFRLEGKEPPALLELHEGTPPAFALRYVFEAEDAGVSLRCYSRSLAKLEDAAAALYEGVRALRRARCDSSVFELPRISDRNAAETKTARRAPTDGAA